MFGRGFLLSTFILAVIFASTVYSWKQECQNGFCKEWDDQGNLFKCTQDGAEISCDSSPSAPAAGGHQKPSFELQREKRKTKTSTSIPKFNLTKEYCKRMTEAERADLETLNFHCPPGPYPNNNDPSVQTNDYFFSKEECEKMTPEQKAFINKSETNMPGLKLCPSDSNSNDPTPTDPTTEANSLTSESPITAAPQKSDPDENGAEKIGYGLDFLIAFLFTYLFLH